jgi:hypothetical protein
VQAVDEHVEIGMRQGGVGTAKRGHDLDTGRIKVREIEGGDRVEPLQAGLAEPSRYSTGGMPEVSLIGLIRDHLLYLD